MAEICAAPVEKFVELWFAESSGLGLGTYASYQDYVRHICEKLSLKAAENLINLAAVLPVAVTRQHITVPREGAIELLSDIKSRGLKTGLITDCGPDVPEIWNEMPYAPYFDVAVFSCAVGMNKGDPRIFQIAVERLALKPEDCIYIADGMRNELANAAGLGMKAVQILVPNEIDDSPIRENWQGTVIASLQEVPNLLK